MSDTVEVEVDGRSGTMIVRPEGSQYAAPGVRFWTVPQCEALVGREVTVCDWYATFRAHVKGVASVSPHTGFVSALTLTYQGRDGEVTRAFSLNATREIRTEEDR